jgi:prophage regulatory protein
VQQQIIPDVGFVKLAQVLKVIPVSKSTWFRGIVSGKYPKPVKIGARASAWRVEDIRDCIAGLAAETTHNADGRSISNDPS